jgi:alanine-glyoxylate transaminase/serine-glyoxylate transaminase/serine-pyruvate transaminase
MVDKAPQERLSVIFKHLESRPQIPITTPYSVGGNSSRHPQIRISSSNLQSLEKSKMSNQPEHPALLIPGPIEFDDAVLQSMSHFRYVLEPLGL